MQLDIVDYHELLQGNEPLIQFVNDALHKKGIIGVKNVPGFVEKSQRFLKTARQFSALDEAIKRQYSPDREIGRTEGYELGAEKFMDQHGDWHIDDKKASFYAFVPDDERNKWPRELDLKTDYLALGQLMFETGKTLLDFIGINQAIGIVHEEMSGYGRMLHYQKTEDTRHLNPNWCGAHFDHGVFTSLMPAYYFKDGMEIDEPDDAGLYIRPTQYHEFVKVDASDKSVLYFQVGEFAQLVSNDRICATEHFVKKASGNIERFTLAVFFSAADNALIQSSSRLNQDARYASRCDTEGRVNYFSWQEASYQRYHAK